MAEFVELALERLLPAFEQLKLTQLLNPAELDNFIKQCRAFEYKCSKRTKLAKDFLAFAEYIAGQLSIIERRRHEMKFMHRYDAIERPLKEKCAFLYRICSQRFRKLEYYYKEISFLHSANMLKACSLAYTRLLQVHGHLPDNFIRAARFEFFDNHHSADSARSILAVGLRKFPKEPQLWVVYFEIELRYVEYLLQRQQFFLSREQQRRTKTNDKGVEEKEGDHAETINDDVLELKLARIVYEMAMKNIEDAKQKTKLLRNFLQIAMSCTFAADLEQSLREHLKSLGQISTSGDSDAETEAQIPDEQLFEIDTELIQRQEDDPNVEEREEKKKIEKKGKKKSVLDGFDPDDPEIKKLLSKATLTEDYDKRPLEEVLAVSARQQKKQRKILRERTAGKSWHGMPATELTDERRHDLEVVQMRDALDPKQHYKKPDRAQMPKYFQIGQIVESRADFYSARLTKKQRKRTMVEELMEDHELLARNKRRYTEIVRRKEATSRGAFQSRRTLPKRSWRKNKQRSH